MSSPEKYSIEKDIKVLCITASSFPKGVKEAHLRLHALFPSDERMFYGISRPDQSGEIIYKAAAEQLHPDEAEKHGLETFVIRKGEYVSKILKDWCKEEMLVGETFRRLLAGPGIDKNGYCLEIYLDEKDMRCLVPLTASQNQNRLKLIPVFF